jgi:hypothetical protein
LFALDPAGLPPRCTRCTLRLLHLLLALGRRLLLLAFLDRGLTGCGAGFGALGAAVFDDVEGGTDNGTLMLDGASGALLGGFLDK